MSPFEIYKDVNFQSRLELNHVFRRHQPLYTVACKKEFRFFNHYTLKGNRNKMQYTSIYINILVMR